MLARQPCRTRKEGTGDTESEGYVGGEKWNMNDQKTMKARERTYAVTVHVSVFNVSIGLLNKQSAVFQYVVV